MERIAIAGLSIHGADLAGLEQVVRPADDAALRDLADALGASELVVLATCNRVEVVYAREEGDPPAEADLDLLAEALTGASASGPAARPHRASAPGAALRERLLLRTGRDAARHLFRVAASLDSLVVGEDQIIAQVRAAYGRAADIGLVGPLLGPLFHHALAVGKRARSDTGLARHCVSVVSIAARELLRRAEGAPLRVAVVGAGATGSLVARVLAGAGLPPALVVNRTLERARLVADDCGASAASLAAFARGEFPVDALVSATSAPGFVLRAAELSRLAAATPSGRPLVAIDLAVPRDLEPAPGEPRVEIVDLETLRDAAAHNRALRAEAARAAEQLVEEKVETFARRFGEQSVAPVVSELNDASREVLERELAGLLGGRLAHLDDADRRAVERWARATFGRLAHLPVRALKQLAADLGAAASGAVEQAAPRAAGTPSRDGDASAAANGAGTERSDREGER